jgi:hypothetical protein
MTTELMTIPANRIDRCIVMLRGEKVILDRDLAALYGVSTKALKQAVRRNRSRFPEDFAFALTKDEFMWWRSQFVTSTADRKGLRHVPFAFTEQGVAMLSSVLNSERAVNVNIEIMRSFVRMRRLSASDAVLARKVLAMENKYDAQFKVVFDAIRELMTPPTKTTKKIGFVK